MLDADDAKALAEVAPREVLLAQLAGAMAAPMVQFAGLLQALPRNFAYGLKALIDQKGGVPEAPPPTSPPRRGGGRRGRRRRGRRRGPAAERRRRGRRRDPRRRAAADDDRRRGRDAGRRRDPRAETAEPTPEES